MSVVREAERLRTLALRTDNSNDEDISQLRKAAEYVVDFNMKALHRVEAMFFPWMRQQISQSALAQPTTKEAFYTLLEHLEEDQMKLAKIGKRIVS